jgi:hypothetical protein
MFVCCECCVSSGGGLCDGLITRPEESYRLCCVIVCDHVTSGMRRLKLARVVNARKKKKNLINILILKVDISICIVHM